MGTYLLLVSIGPIQDFIASARKSRDLWFGSWLLSELSKAAARQIVQAQNDNLESLIFPNPKNSDALQAASDLNVANKILAMVDLPSDEAVRTFGDETIQNAIDNRLQAIRDAAYAHINGNFDRENAAKQVADMVEYYWVAMPFSENKLYKETRQTLEALMATRKVTRNFEPVSWGSNVPKSSLDGLRESVIPEHYYPTRSDEGEKRKQKIRRLYTNYAAGQAERLSGVDLLKRLGGNRGSESQFLSTSHMAAGSFLARLEKADRNETIAAWNRYQSSLKQLDCMREEIGRRFAAHPVIQHTDAAIFFEERLPELLGDPPTAHVQSARDELTAFLKQTIGTNNCPKPYYALLLADGDRMGKIIDNQDTPSKHRALSQALDGFALHTKVIVENEHQGSLFYSGGDDVLAMVPLHTVLQCAQTLATDFKERLQHFTDEEGNGPTLSVGIAVTHHLEPMSDALDLARQAEKEAKTTRNALAVTVSKRSGSDRTVAGAWSTIDEQLETFILFHRHAQIPDGAAYELAKLADDPGDELPAAALQQEAIRILRRKRTSDDQQIEKSLRKTLEVLVKSTQSAQDLKQLAHRLIVARLFADARNLADMELANTEEKEQAA